MIDCTGVIINCLQIRIRHTEQMGGKKVKVFYDNHDDKITASFLSF